jgi:photosystem II stability/assembly factor-like uncharacterized protein
VSKSRLHVLAVVFALLACVPVHAHDPSAYGGLFRTRNWGANWLNADVGLFLGAAIALSINPTDPNHLLLGTDTGVLVSRNGGRQWTREAPDRLFGQVFAVAFLSGGQHAVCATPGGVYRFDGTQWARVDAPREAAPARAIVTGSDPARLYLIGRRDLYTSIDAGTSWTRTEHGMPDGAEFTELAIARVPAETLYAIVDGQLMQGFDTGRRWASRPLGDGQPVSGLSVDPAQPGRIWAGAGERVYRSDDGAATWSPFGNPLPDAGTSVRGVSADPAAAAVIVATQRGLYHSADGGITWRFLEDNLPVHLEARPLVNDPSVPGTVYAGFALLPYAEIWRVALEGGNLLSRIDPVSLAGGLAFLLLLLLLGTLGARWLLRRGERPRLLKP